MILFDRPVLISSDQDLSSDPAIQPFLQGKIQVLHTSVADPTQPLALTGSFITRAESTDSGTDLKVSGFRFSDDLIPTGTIKLKLDGVEHAMFDAFDPLRQAIALTRNQIDSAINRLELAAYVVHENHRLIGSATWMEYHA